MNDRSVWLGIEGIFLFYANAQHFPQNRYWSFFVKYMASTATPAQRHDDGVNLMERRIGSEMDMDLAQQQHASAKECAKNEQRKSEVQKQSCHDAEKLDWTSTEQGK